MIKQWNVRNVTEHVDCTEGTLYKVLTVSDRYFPLYYGYYDDCDRRNPMIEPMPIYPDFIQQPCFTSEGHPFVTKMQDACKHYLGIVNGCEECAECAWYRHGEELLGICTCPKNRKEVQQPAGGEDT